MNNIKILNSHKPAIIRLTRTMLEKAIIDANASIRNFSKLCGVNFDEMNSGDRQTIKAAFLDGTETQLSFYRTKNARGDRRFSIKGIKQQAKEGDTVAITFEQDLKGETVLIINITENTEYAYLEEVNQ
tara:strand:- start:2351 stop:2737 length:387 start_codon:yes stop_codon:yes gene_type:complete